MIRAAASYLEPREGYADEDVGPEREVGRRQQHNPSGQSGQSGRHHQSGQSDSHQLGAQELNNNSDDTLPVTSRGSYQQRRPSDSRERSSYNDDKAQREYYPGSAAREYSWKTPDRVDENVAFRKKFRHYIGLEPHKDPKQHHPGSETLWWSRARATMQEPFSEFLGVMVFTMVLQGGLAQATLGGSVEPAPGSNGYGSWLTVPFCTGIGILLGVYVAGDSGSYLNPAITVANCLFRGLPWRTLPIITLAQTFGAFLATGITYGIYSPAINSVADGQLLLPPSAKATASIFTSFPQPFSSTTSQVFSVIQRSAIMQCVISALKDDYNLGQRVSAGGTNMFPLNLFFLFFGLTAATGWETSGQTNPALDLGGRIMASCLGYPNEMWSMHDGYAWIPIICPCIGACLGNWVYDVFVFTGSSPVNAPKLGFEKLWRPKEDLENRKQRYIQRADPDHEMP